MPPKKKHQGLTIFSPQALEGKDIKELLTNVGSGGPAAPAGAAPAAGEAAAAEEKKEEKEEGESLSKPLPLATNTNLHYREGRVRRGHGLRSVRLSVYHIPKLNSFSSCFIFRLFSLTVMLSSTSWLPQRFSSCTRYSANPVTNS